VDDVPGIHVQDLARFFSLTGSLNFSRMAGATAVPIGGRVTVALRRSGDANDRLEFHGIWQLSFPMGGTFTRVLLLSDVGPRLFAFLWIRPAKKSSTFRSCGPDLTFVKVGGSGFACG
jgi:hypothetical protein